LSPFPGTLLFARGTRNVEIHASAENTPAAIPPGTGQGYPKCNHSSPRLRQIPAEPRWHRSRPKGGRPKPRLTASPGSFTTPRQARSSPFLCKYTRPVYCGCAPSLHTRAMELQRKEYPALLVSRPEPSHQLPLTMRRLPSCPRKPSPSSMIA
jgi:hypothetical protein